MPSDPEGLFGRGLGNSIQKLGSVPEAQNDMIFSIICEELGIFGGIFVLILFGYLLYRLFFIAQNAPDLFGSLIVTGIFIHIALQVILNIAVVLESDAQYRCHIALYQLRRNIHFVPDAGDGNSSQCGSSDKISRIK